MYPYRNAKGYCIQCLLTDFTAVIGKFTKKYRTPHIKHHCWFDSCNYFRSFSIDLIGELVSIGTLLAFAMVCISIILLRIKRRDMHRPFKHLLLFRGICRCTGMCLPYDIIAGIYWFVLGMDTAGSFNLLFLRDKAQQTERYAKKIIFLKDFCCRSP